jgi:hypothetical protein
MTFRRFSRRKTPRKSKRMIRRSSNYKIAAATVLLSLLLLYATSKKETNAGTNAGTNTLESIANLQGYTIKNIKGDGSCMFRSIADQMEGNENKYQLYRTKAVKYLSEHLTVNIARNITTMYPGKTINWYLKNMGDIQKNMWGDDIMLQILSNITGRRIRILHFNSKVPITIIEPTNLYTQELLQSNGPDISVGHIPEEHYVSLYRQES